MVSLKFDACHIYDKVKYNPHTNQLVGFAYDAFDKNALLEDLHKLSDDHCEDSKSKVNDNRAKQYLIFMINRWERNMKPMKYVIARYAVSSGVSSSLLLSEIPKIIASLYYFGIIVNNVTGDGASENRSAFCALYNISMKEIIDNISLTLTTGQQTILPLLGHKVAFKHPIQDDITIFIGGEMPHLIKKIINALERSGSAKSTDLIFRNQPMTLAMIQQVWLCEQREATIANLRTIFLTTYHFPPRTLFHRMNVFLAIQVIGIIDMYADKCGGNEKYIPLRVLMTKLDRLVDISNNTKTNNRGIVKGCEEIDSPNHFHLKELLEILELFAEWKTESKTKVNFIPYQLYEDLILLCTTMIGIASTYLKVDKTRIMVQRRGGSDDCEHEFGGIREKNDKPTALDVQQGVARRTGTKTSTFNFISKANTSGDKAIFTNEIKAKLKRKQNKLKRE